MSITLGLSFILFFINSVNTKEVPLGLRMVPQFGIVYNFTQSEITCTCFKATKVSKAVLLKLDLFLTRSQTLQHIREVENTSK